jgi:hypothetical protein
MTSRERVLTALQRQSPDRVPFVEMVIDPEVGRIFTGSPGAAPAPRPPAPVITDNLLGGPAGDAPALAEALDLDALGISFWLRHEGVEAEAGDHRMVAGGRIRSTEDLARIRAQLPDPEDARLYQPVRDFVARHRDTGRALFATINLGSDPVILGMGLDRFSMALFDQPELVRELFEIYSGWYAAAVPRLCATGLDFLWSTDDIAFKTSTYVSPNTIRELFIPAYRRVADRIELPWIYHSDGDLSSVLGDLVSLGMSGLHPLEPGAMDLRQVKHQYGSRLCLCGRIDVDLLSRGTPEDIDRLVREAIDTAAPGGGYIAGSSNSITHYCRPENVLAMRDAIREYGRYT